MGGEAKMGQVGKRDVMVSKRCLRPHKTEKNVGRGIEVTVSTRWTLTLTVWEAMMRFETMIRRCVDDPVFRVSRGIVWDE